MSEVFADLDLDAVEALVEKMKSDKVAQENIRVKLEATNEVLEFLRSARKIDLSIFKQAITM